MNNQFSQRVSDIIVYSKEEANRLRSRHIGPEHLLLGLLRDGEGKAIEILSKLNTNLAAVKQQIEARLKTEADDMLLPDAEIPLSNDAAKILKMCILEARGMRSNIADTEHVLLAILRERNNMAASVLEANDVNYVKVLEQATLQPDVNSGMGFPEDDDDEEMSSPRSGGSGSEERQQQAQTASKKPANDTPVLDNFGTDMTKAAEEGRLDPVVGREKEIERLAQILSRRKKNNPILIGEPGVGKSAIVEGLALRIIQKKVSRILFDKRVVALDMTAVVAGTKYRGQFEERIRSILNELQRNPNVILFIDEIHRLSRQVEEVLYPALEDYALDIMIGKGPSAQSIRINLPRFTLVGATTRAGQITGPLRDRFGVILRLELYTPEQLGKIVNRSAGILNIEVDTQGAREIASRSRGTPRIANRLLKRARDFAQVIGNGVIDAENARAALDRMEIDSLGLDSIDRLLLTAMIRNYNGGPVGLETIAAAIGEEAVTIEDVYEPYLMQIGFLSRTPRGRIVTPAGYRHLGIDMPGQQKLDL